MYVICTSAKSATPAFLFSDASLLCTFGYVDGVPVCVIVRHLLSSLTSHPLHFSLSSSSSSPFTLACVEGGDSHAEEERAAQSTWQVFSFVNSFSLILPGDL